MQHISQNTEHSIHLMIAEMDKPSPSACNFIAFRDQQGANKVLMYGLAIERCNSSIQDLRGVMAPPSAFHTLTIDFSKANDFVLFRGDTKTYHQKMALAVDALHFINVQNLNYRPEERNSNSPNSIAASLIKAMDLKFPEHTIPAWALAFERILLPKNWRAAYV